MLRLMDVGDMAQTLRPPSSPNLPVGPVEYAQDYQNQFTKILRLYFNEVDNTLSVLLENNGGRYLNFPHIAASDSTNQYAAGDNIPTLINWNTEESDGGFDLTLTYAAAIYSGVYRIDYSLEFVNTDNAAHDVLVWLKVNGSNIARSATKFTVPSRKSVGNNGYLCAVSFIIFAVNAGDQIQLYWETDKAYNTVGPVNGVYMYATAANATHPAIPSAVGSITFVSELPQ